MAKKSTAVKPAASQKADPKLTAVARRSSALIDTRVVYCGDNLEKFKKLSATRSSPH